MTQTKRLSMADINPNAGFPNFGGPHAKPVREWSDDKTVVHTPEEMLANAFQRGTGVRVHYVSTVPDNIVNITKESLQPHTMYFDCYLAEDLWRHGPLCIGEKRGTSFCLGEITSVSLLENNNARLVLDHQTPMRLQWMEAPLHPRNPNGATRVLYGQMSFVR